MSNAIFHAVLPDNDWPQRIITIVLLLGFPIVLVLSWVFDIGPSGISRTASLTEGSGRVFRRREVQPKKIELVETAPSAERVASASLAFVRHELRTPVNAILGYSEMLLEDAREENDGVAIADLERINRGGRDILALIESILDADRIAQDTRAVHSYGEQIRADLRDPLSAVTGYTELLIEINEEQGRTRRVDDLRRILTAAQRLLELSNDIVAVATKAPDAAPARMKQGATLAEGVLAKIRAVDVSVEREGSLLVIDDSAVTRDLLAKQLARKGYVVATAANGRAGLQLMNEQRFDLVLLDVLMPEMDGIEVLRRIKSDAALCDVPVIMISALDEIDSVVRCLEIGAADFVSKPFHPAILDARIQSTMVASRAAAAPAIALDADLARLVSGTFPEYVIRRVSAGETRVLDSVPNAAVLFVDLDQAVASSDPRDRAERVETLIALAHEVSAQHGASVLLHGIGLLMAAGFPHSNAEGAERIATVAQQFSAEAKDRGLTCRCALHVGALNGAVVGKNTLAYSVWGEAVDLARRMAIGAERGQIVLSASAQAAVKDRFALTSLGVIEVAGRGQMKAYLLGDEKPVTRV